MKKVLVCALDWGLGHATRSIPVVRELQSQGAEVFLASSGEALELLCMEFPDCFSCELPAHRPVYPDGKSMMFSMVRQLPKFGRTIRREHRLVERLAEDHKIDLIISDNRYGCYSEKTKSIFITHQLAPLMPEGYAWLRPLAEILSGKSLARFNEVWIPDQADGELTRPFISERHPNRKYIGWLSRFHSSVNGQPNYAETASLGKEKKYEALALVSGPEPQRTHFLKLLVDQLKSSGMKSLVIAGEPGNTYRYTDGNVEIINHLLGSELEHAMQSSEIVVCRSGYSTIMDLLALGKKAIFIPTPQQPEQIYLAEYFKEKKIAFSMDQDNFSLSKALEESKHYTGFEKVMVGNDLKQAIESALQ